MGTISPHHTPIVTRGVVSREKSEHDDAGRLPHFLSDASHVRLLLFGGKGGVGKTTCATAAALRLSQSYPKASFLLVSTDPAHSLTDNIGGFSLPHNVKMIELDAQACLATFKEKHNENLREIASRGTFLDDEDISQFLDLSLPGLDEIMAFLEISRWAEECSYDCIVVDTAPTGHTLRLLAMPELILKWLEALDALLAKHRYMKQLFGGTYHHDELDKFLLELSGSVKQMETLLRDPIRCRFVPVMVAEALSTYETLMLVNELERLKVPITDIVVNKLYSQSTCPVCEDGRLCQMRELGNLPEKLAEYALWGLPLYQQEVRGVRLLDEFWQGVFPLDQEIFEIANPWPRPGDSGYGEGKGSLQKQQEQAHGSQTMSHSPRRRLRAGGQGGHQSSIINVESPADLPCPEMTLFLFAGKGGVGKTTLACATALRMACELGDKEIFLFSTDPAHSLSACLDTQIGAKPTRLIPGLTAMEIDSQSEFQTLKDQYAEELEGFLSAISPNLDLTFDREVMERIMDLSPPGLDEVMALTMAIEFLAQRQYDVFILDSAPTGHLIRLLEIPELIDQWLKTFFGLFLKYKHVFRLPKVSQRLVQMSRELKYLRSMLHDPKRSALYAVTILAEMAFQETKDLLDACNRMGIMVPLMFLNLATPLSECLLCSALYQRETHVKKKFLKSFSGIHQTLVYRRDEPRGLDRLGELGEVLYRPKGKVGIEGFGN
jgi:arsenite-transporting ATPase